MAIRTHSSNILAEIQAALSARLTGQVSFDPYTRAMYSTDGSVYQIEPLGVVFPRSEDDLFATVEVANQFQVPLLPRGAGTSLAGQAVGAALVVDCSRHLNRIHRLDIETQTADVGAGVVCTTLNQAAGKHGLKFGPDPASADRATFGGMIGNNASGSHSIRYGTTADHIILADVILSDGTAATFSHISLAEAEARAAHSSLEGRIYRSVLGLRTTAAEAVQAHWPRTWRRASGYSLNYITGFSASRPPVWHLDSAPYISADGINLAPLLAGSEGTLALIRRAQVRLVPRPASTVVVLLGFDSVSAASDAVPQLLELRPSAVELIPRALLQRAAAVPAYARKLTFLDGDPAALLAVEFSGETPAEALGKAQPICAQGRVLATPELQADLWGVRKVGLGLLMSIRGDTKPTTFVEDVAVPVEKLGAFVRSMEQVMTHYGIQGEWYGHASAGCLHLRPLLNLKAASGVAAMQAIAEQCAYLVVSMGGSLSGEHGDGLSRTAFNEKLFGPELVRAFRELKTAFDPGHLLNPGKVVPETPGDQPPITGNLRYGPSYQTQRPNTVFAFRREGGLARAVEDCVGAGVCRQDGGVMCPSYQATRDENHLTRGRANALRAALSGHLPAGALTSPQMHAVFDLCLECKGCKAECPTGVDIARVKAEFLSLYHAEHGTPLRSLFFGEIHRIFSAATPFGGLVNFMNQQPAVRWVLNKALGISRQRTLPRFARRTFKRGLPRQRSATSAKQVVLFVDTFTQFNYPELGQAAMRVLEAAGYTVEVVPQQTCCGRTMVSKGLLVRARQQAERNLDFLAPYAARGISIIGLEPSCLLTLRDEYLDLFPDDPRARQLAAASFLIEEFLTQPGNDGRSPVERLRFRAPHSEWLLHSHCYTKSLVGSAPMLALLRAAGLSVQEIPSGCCGMAGSFGYEAEHEQLSRDIGELKLMPAVRAGVSSGKQVAAAGVSCRTQIYDSTQVRARHPIEVLSDALIGNA